MAKKSFLVPVAMAFSGLVQDATAAITQQSDVSAQPAPSTATNNIIQSGLQAGLPSAGQSVDVQSQDENGDLFKFVIQRSSDGQILADHFSHSSHSSHRSHASSAY